VLAKCQRFPVAYLETSELMRRLRLNPDELVRKPLLGRPAQSRIAACLAAYAIPADASGSKATSFTDTIAETKRVLAESLGIGAQKIDITIRL
jgi:hypothetical protein